MISIMECFLCMSNYRYELLHSDHNNKLLMIIHQCLQAYGFIRILYGIALENTEYGESDLIYGYAFLSRSKNGRHVNVPHVPAQVEV